MRKLNIKVDLAWIAWVLVGAAVAVSVYMVGRWDGERAIRQESQAECTALIQQAGRDISGFVLFVNDLNQRTNGQLAAQAAQADSVLVKWQRIADSLK